MRNTSRTALFAASALSIVAAVASVSTPTANAHGPARSGPYPGRDDVLSVNVLDAFNGFFNFGYQHAFNRWLALHGGMDFLAFDGVLDDRDGSTIAAGPSFGVNFHVIGQAPTGFWLGPYLAGSWVRAEWNNRVAEDFGYALGGRMGLSGLIDWFHIAGSIGGLWRDYSVDIEGDRIGPRGFRPRFELSLGVAF